MTSSFSILKTISPLIERYDIFLLDLWGVIHDGREAYEGANEALQVLRKANKQLVFISNAPRRASLALAGLDRMGIERSENDYLVTSGEMTYLFLTSSSSMPGKKHIMIGPDRDNGLLDGTDYVRVENPREADFGIITGYDEDHSSEDEKDEVLALCREQNMPLICANPDIQIVRIDGTRAYCAGVIAKRYEAMGGTVTYFGKPFKSIYEHILSRFSLTSTAPMVAIGDSLLTDIAGAHQMGIDNYLVAGGIHGSALNIMHGQCPSEEALRLLCEQEKAPLPTGVLPELVV